MGMHGAAIVHGIFIRRGAISIEWKTLYDGYDSNLFSIVSDAQVGVHGQVDVRKYFICGGHRPVDAALVTRSLAVLREIGVETLGETHICLDLVLFDHSLTIGHEVGREARRIDAHLLPAADAVRHAQHVNEARNLGGEPGVFADNSLKIQCSFISINNAKSGFLLFSTKLSVVV